ncbi:MAG: hypothetical protein AAGU77_00265 [Bacillota bacterium]
MKRVISAICILVMMLAASATALAASVVVTAEPQQLESAGTVKISFTIKNDSTYEMRNISISGYSLTGSRELEGLVIAPGGERSFYLPNVQVIDDMLGQPLSYTLAWVENGDQKSKSVSVTIEGPQQALEMTATRTADKTSGKEGEKVTLVYTLNNPGEVEMTNISITDSAIKQSPIATGLKIKPGDQPLNITYEYTLGKEDVVSQPVITYKLNGEGKTYAIPDKLTLKVLKVAKIEATASAGTPTPEGVEFTLTLRNTGNQAISGIRVMDEQNNQVVDQAINLGVGEDTTLTVNIPNPSALRNVRFIIMDGNNTEIAETENYEVWPYVDPSHVSLALTVTVKKALSDSGRMQVSFAIQNNSNVEMTNAVIAEDELGTLETIDVLQLGETAVEKELLVGEPRELHFTLTASDPSGAQHAYQATLTAAYEAAATPTPVVEEEPEPEQSKGMSGTLITVLIVLAALMAVAGIALLALSIYERRRNAAMDTLEEPEIPHSRAGAQTRASVIGRHTSERFANRAGTTAEDDEPDVRTYIPNKANSQGYAPEQEIIRPATAPQERITPVPQARAMSTPQERPVPPAQQAAPVEPPHVPQASPEIRNRVRRVRPVDEDKS